MTDKPLSSTERAEKILYLCVKTANQPDDKSAIGLIAAEIDGAVKSAVEESRRQHNERVSDVVKDIKREAYEDAANIILATEDPIDAIEQIRAKAKELK